MGIPVASMACSTLQEEQVENFEYYTSNAWCVPMDEYLDIESLIRRDVSKQKMSITKMIEGREEKILKLIEILG